MFLNIWVLILFLPLVCSLGKEKEDTVSYSLASLFKAKCEGLPFRSYFNLGSMTCYVLSDSKNGCSDINLTYGKEKRGISAGDAKKLKSIGITEGSLTKICAFEFQGNCDSGEQFQDWCYSKEQKRKSFHDAAEFCEKKGSTLAVLHNDADIQRFFTATMDLKSNFYWIGAATVETVWQFHDGTEVDFFRFQGGRRFRNTQMGLLLKTRSKNDSYNGYMDVAAVSKKYPFICASRLNSSYRTPPKINKFPSPVTTTTPLPTTRYPKIQNPKEWIADPVNGKSILRSFNKQYQIHHYTLTPYSLEGFAAEKSPGFVVTEARFPQIEDTCPELMKVGLWKKLTMSYIGNNPPQGFTLSDSFYCSPRHLYCGANFQLRRVDKIGGGDIFYASDDDEANRYISSAATEDAPANYRRERGSFLETPCWIWQNYLETNNTIVKAGGGMLWNRNDVYSHYQWSFSLDIYEASLQENARNRPGVGYVILEELYDAYFKEKCPELMPMRVWHGSNGGLEYNTWFGLEGVPPAAHINQKVYQEARKFYCAPRQDYCGANFLLRRCDRTNPTSKFGPQSWYPADDGWERAEKDWARKQEICYIWKRWW